MTNNAKKHKGEIVKKIIAKLGLKKKEVANQLEVSRGTLYNYFDQEELDDHTLLKLGRVLRHDFSVMFPELIPLKEELEEEEGLDIYGLRTTEELVEIQRKYFKLLEKYTVLLKFLVRVCVDFDLGELKHEVLSFEEKYFTHEEIKLSEKIDNMKK